MTQLLHASFSAGTISLSKQALAVSNSCEQSAAGTLTGGSAGAVFTVGATVVLMVGTRDGTSVVVGMMGDVATAPVGAMGTLVGWLLGVFVMARVGVAEGT